MQEVLKVLGRVVDKHMYTSLIACVLSGIALPFIKDGNIFIVEYGKIFSFILLAITFFLVLEFVRWFMIGLMRRESRAEVNKHNQAEINATVDIIRNRVNQLNPSDRELLKEFVESNNKPIIRNGNTLYGSSSLLGSDWIISTVMKTDDDTVQLKKNNSISPVYMSLINSKKQYMLKEDIFKILKYIQNKYGKLSHFE